MVLLSSSRLARTSFFIFVPWTADRFKSLGTNLFLHLCAMNCRPLSIDLDMGKTIDGSRQLTYKCRESLVACLVALLATCRDTWENHLSNLAPKLSYKFLCYELSHLGLIAAILEIKDSLSVEYAIYAHILDASWIVTEETAEFLVLLTLIAVSFFISLSLNPFGLWPGKIFSAPRSAGTAIRQVCCEEYSFRRKGRLFTKHDLLFDADVVTSQKKLSAVTCPTWRLVKPSSELEFIYSSRVLTCKDIITVVSPFGSIIWRAKLPFMASCHNL